MEEKSDIVVTGIREYLTLWMNIGVKELFISHYNFSKLTKKQRMLNIAYQVETCNKCSLHKNRKNIVVGEGNLNSKIVFVGEAPGVEEDLAGRPFVGLAGKLLTKIINAMGLDRRDVFICNILKCHPPNNRNPLPDEVSACICYLKTQIEIINPEVIITLGSYATRALLNTTEGVSNLRGRFWEYCGIPLMPTYHPAYLLRNPQDKRKVWEDMKKVMKKLGL